MAGALQRRGSLPNKIMLALQQHSEQHQTTTTFEVRNRAAEMLRLPGVCRRASGCSAIVTWKQ
jgi:hypothetical protein